MTRFEKVDISIKKAINAGYEFLEEGKGTQNDALEKYRAQGYDVKGWYTSYMKDNMSWVMYGKLKNQRSSDNLITKKPNYAEMNVKTLKKICSEKKIPGYSKMNKQQIIEVLAAC